MNYAFLKLTAIICMIFIGVNSPIVNENNPLFKDECIDLRRKTHMILLILILMLSVFKLDILVRIINCAIILDPYLCYVR